MDKIIFNVITILATAYMIVDSVKERKTGVTILWATFLALDFICLGINLTKL